LALALAPPAMYQDGSRRDSWLYMRRSFARGGTSYVPHSFSVPRIAF
jgi:hypothetical protein